MQRVIWNSEGQIGGEKLVEADWTKNGCKRQSDWSILAAPLSFLVLDDDCKLPVDFDLPDGSQISVTRYRKDMEAG